MIIELKIQKGSDREKLMVALGNSGYFTRVVEMKQPGELSSEYFIQITPGTHDINIIKESGDDDR